MKKNPLTRTTWAAVLPLAAMLLAGSRLAHAQPTYVAPTRSIQTVNDTPAATLLLPYFEVDLSNPLGKNTIFTINEVGELQFVYAASVFQGINQNGPTAVLAHVTIWSDLGVPVFNFNVYLTGFDVETINMRTVLSGTLPQTASAGQDMLDHISPKGSASQDINFASCNGILPPAPLTMPQIANLTTSLTGNASASNSGKCAGLNHGDNIARGYVTVDLVNNCTARNPGDVGYFAAGGTGDATNQNNLTGEVFYVDQSQGVARGANLVHIHADPANALINAPFDYTFYGRLDKFTAVDYRQPLATTFAARFNPSAASSPAPTGANLIVWRDPKVLQGYFTCGVLPAWYPLGQDGIAAFDEQEHIQLLAITPPGSAHPFPAVTQVVPVGAGGLAVSYAAGWLWLDLNTTVSQAGGFTASDSGAAQAWVQVLEKLGLNQFVVQHNAQQLDSATAAVHIIP